MRKILNLIIKLSIYGLAFLVPLLWLPWTVEAYELNKQYLIFFLVGLAFAAWLAKMILVKQKFIFKRSPLDVWILLFVVGMVLAAFFSLDSVSSWLGFYGRFSGAVIITIVLSLMYFILVNNISTDKERESLALKGKLSKGLNLSLKKIVNIILLSSSLVMLIGYLSVFGFWSRFSGLPTVMNLKSFNPISGSLEGLAVFLAMAVSLAAGLMLGGLLVGKKGENKDNPPKRQGFKGRQLFYFIYLLAGMVLLVIINFWPAWLSLGATMLVLLILSIWAGLFRKRPNSLTLPILLLVVSIIFLVQLPTKTGFVENLPELPKEIILDYKTTNTVVWQTFKDQPVFGTGQGTFFASFAKLKPAEFNESEFWNIRFDNGPSQILEYFATIGLVGLLPYLAIIVVFLLISVFAFRRGKEEIAISKEAGIILGLFSAWLAVFVGQFVYQEKTTLNFLFWLLLALVIVGWRGVGTIKNKRLTFSFKKLPEVGLVLNVVLLMFVFVLVGLFYLGGRFYLADIKYAKTVKSSDKLIENLEDAVNLNKYREAYRRTLSQKYLLGAWAEARKPKEEQNMNLIRTLAAGSIEQARKAAVEISPNLVTTHENLGIIYRDSSGLIGGTLSHAFNAFKKASDLEPTNPVLFRELCRLSLTLQEKEWEETVNYCQKSVDLKGNYLDAHIQLALIHEKKGDLETAVKQMEEALSKLKGGSFQRGSALAKAATEIYFQLGRLYFNLGLMHLDKAITMFEQSVFVSLKPDLTPQYPNAHYALGVAYQAKDRLQGALTQFQIVKRLVPNNQKIDEKINQIKSQLGGAEEGAE